MGRSWALRASGGVGAEGSIDEMRWSLGWRDKRQSLALVVSCHALSRMPWLSLEKTVTACLPKRTLQPWSQIFPIPRRLCWKVGMTWQLQAGRLGRLRLAEAEEAWTRPDALPTWDVGACGLMLHNGAVGVTYMSVSFPGVESIHDSTTLSGRY